MRMRFTIISLLSSYSFTSTTKIGITVRKSGLAAIAVDGRKLGARLQRGRGGMEELRRKGRGDAIHTHTALSGRHVESSVEVLDASVRSMMCSTSLFPCRLLFSFGRGPRGGEKTVVPTSFSRRWPLYFESAHRSPSPLQGPASLPPSACTPPLVKGYQDYHTISHSSKLLSSTTDCVDETNA